MKLTIEKLKFLTSKHSPELCLVAGITAIVGGTIYACYKSRSLNDMRDEYNFEKELVESEYLEKVKDVIPDAVDPRTVTVDNAEDEYKTDIVKFGKEKKHGYLKLKTEYALEYARMYTPSVVAIGGGIALIVYGHQILCKRNAALLGAYATLEQAFTDYRSRVRDRYGEQIEYDIYTGQEYKEITSTVDDENGKKKKVKDLVPVVSDAVSPYSRIFDEGSREHFKSFTMNRTFLECQQNMANDKLQRDGHLFLNTVYEMLGFDADPTGAICGWLRDDPDGDSFVDFGIVPDEENNRFLLNFNCQGMIYDKI